MSIDESDDVIDFLSSEGHIYSTMKIVLELQTVTSKAVKREVKSRVNANVAIKPWPTYLFI